MDGRYPNNFIKLVPFIEKLKNKSFLLIDIAEYFLDCQFQLNLSIFKGLLFYFYLPKDLHFTQAECQEIEQLLGEIINQSWLQFEYHYFQLVQSNDNQKQLELLKVIPRMLIETPQKQREIIEQEFRNILKIQDTALLQEDLEYFIQKQLPIVFEIQRLYYQVSFYFLSVFHQQYKRNKGLYETERNKLLNSYIEEKAIQNSQQQEGFSENEFQDNEFQDNQLDKFFVNYQVQQTLNKYGGKGINFKSNEQLLQYFIDTNFYYFNKQIHIVDISQQNKSYAKILNLLTEISDQDKRKIQLGLSIYNKNYYSYIIFQKQKQKQNKKIMIQQFLAVATIIKKIIQESQSIIQIIDDLFELKNQYDEEQLEIIFRIICEMLKIDFQEFWIYKFALNRNFRRKHIPNLKKISLIKENMIIQEMMQLIKNFDKEFWEILQSKYHKCYCTIINSLIQHQMQNRSGNQKDAITILRDRFNQNSRLQKYNENTYLFYHLLQNLQGEEVNCLFIENQKQNISLQSYLSSVNILFKVFRSLSNESDKQQFKTNLEKGLKLFTSYHLNFLIELAQNQISKDILDKIYTLVYYWAFKKQNKLEQEAQSFFKNDSPLYQKIFSKLNYFDNEQLTSEHLEYIEKKELCDIYPRSLQIGLEEFNITLVQLNQQDQDQLIQNWVQDIKNNKKFKDLIPFYFNIIKRDESSTNFLEMINQQLQSQQELVVKYGYFNQKSMIQLLYCLFINILWLIINKSQYVQHRLKQVKLNLFKK